MAPCIIITCEHGGNKIPSHLRRLFKGKEKIVESHLGWDPGAMDLAKGIAISINAPLYYEEISRLVVEQNRSCNSKFLFSKYLNKLSRQEKELLLNEIYDPYHKKVREQIDSAISNKIQVCHFSIHTFTPVLNGNVRNTDLGLLYDPSRRREKETCLYLQSELLNKIPGVRIRRNYPYTGVSDGHTTCLRKIYPENLYCGIELEVNQKLYFKKTDMWKSLGEKLSQALLSLR